LREPSQFCTGVCDEKAQALEAEESELLEDVDREMLVKTQRAGKCLEVAVMICEL
jgi:hypothetical protein